MKKGLLFLVSIVLILPIVPAANYYVSPTGSASWSQCINIGTPCSLATANTNAQAGDAVYLREGTYTTSINPTNSGSLAGGAITYKAYSTKPTIKGTLIPLDLRSGQDYITLDNINFGAPTGSYGRWADLNDNNNIIIKNGLFDDLGTRAYQTSGHFLIGTVQYLQVIDTVFDGSESISGYGSDLIKYGALTNSLFLRSTFGNAEHFNLMDYGGDYVIVWDSIVENKWHGGLGLGKTNQHTLVHGTTFKNHGVDYSSSPAVVYSRCDDGAGGFEPCYPAKNTNIAIQYSGDNNIIRENIFYDNDASLGWWWGTKNTNNNWVYHNTIYNTVDTGGDSVSGTPVWGEGAGAYEFINNHIVNNIIWKGEDTEQFHIYSYGSSKASSNQIANNIIGDPSKQSSIVYEGIDQSTHTLVWHQNNQGSEWFGNIENTFGEPPDADGSPDPLMNNPDNQDFTLQSNSPAINAGRHMTTANGADDGTGNDNTLVVHDSGWAFTTGSPWNINHPDVSSDTIYFQDENNNWIEKEVIAIDYTTHTLTLESSATWVHDTSIYYKKFQGSAPDIGAYEYLVSGSDCGAADNNPRDSVVSMIELMSYISDWKAGGVDMVDLMAGIGEWKNGC